MEKSRRGGGADPTFGGGWGGLGMGRAEHSGVFGSFSAGSAPQSAGWGQGGRAHGLGWGGKRAQKSPK